MISWRYFMITYEQLKDNKYIEYFNIKKQHDLQGLTKEELMEHFQREKERMRPYMIKYDNQFMHINNFADRHVHMFTSDDEIVVQEKIDGANSHFIVTDGGFECFGNNYVLNEVNNLEGFWYWCRDNFEKVISKYYGVSIYGEWLTPHHCEYPIDKYGEFYVFDVIDSDGKYWTQDRVEQLTIDCGFNYAPVLYRGKFESWKHLMSIVGTTKFGGSKGEGVVVKNQTRLNSKRYEFYIKIVDVEFQETNALRKVIKTVDLDKAAELEEKVNLTKSIVTVPRVRKMLLKLISENHLPSTWYKWETNQIVPMVKRAVYNDCVREEPEITAKIGKVFGKYCNTIVRDIIIEMQKEMKESNS